MNNNQQFNSIQFLINNLAVFVVVGMLSLGGCAGDDGTEIEDSLVVTTNSAPVLWDLSEEDELIAYLKLQMKSYSSGGYTEITSGTTTSMVSTDTMRVWVNDEQAQNYQNLNLTSHFPVGTTVLRVMHDPAGLPKLITAMVKAAPGTNPASADWIFAVADINGVIARDDLGQWRFGALEECNLCHTTRLGTDGLFGVTMASAAQATTIQ